MRQESQHFDKIRATLELVIDGIGQTGKAPVVAIYRISDGLWLQAGGASFGAGFATNTMSEVDSSNLPGIYHYAVMESLLGYSSGLDGYYAYITEDTTATTEGIYITVYSTEVSTAGVSAIADAVWDEVATGHVSSNSFGLIMQIAAGLSHRNFRIKDPLYDDAGRLTSCTMAVYSNGADTLSDTNAIASINVVSVYDGDGNMSAFVASE